MICCFSWLLYKLTLESSDSIVKADWIPAGVSETAGMACVNVEAHRTYKTEVQTGVGGSMTARTVVVSEEEVSPSRVYVYMYILAYVLIFFGFIVESFHLSIYLERLGLIVVIVLTKILIVSVLQITQSNVG